MVEEEAEAGAEEAIVAMKGIQMTEMQTLLKENVLYANPRSICLIIVQGMKVVKSAIFVTPLTI